MMKLAILSRDGTLNALGDDTYVGETYIGDPDDWNALPGALEAVARLNHAGWRVAVATNQPGLGGGVFDMAALNAIHARMHRQLVAVGGRIDAVFYCPHAADAGCSCRKPAPGLLEQICERYGVEPRNVPVVGSCAAHLSAGAALGAPLHLVCTGQSAHLDPLAPLGEGAWPPGVQVHADLAAFAESLLAASAVPATAASPASPASSTSTATTGTP